MAIEHIENSFLKVAVNTLGAELTSLFNKATEAEMLWQADANVWGRHAPVLFPFVGRLKDGVYHYEGKTYEMGQHGFARNMPFETVFKSPTRLEFLLTSNEASKQHYPFDFELRLTYELQENKLIQSYQVANVGEKPMWFSIGAHPGFNLEGAFSDYRIVFGAPEPALMRTTLQEGLLNTPELVTLQNDCELPLHHDLFAKDALVFEHLNSEAITIKRLDENALTMHFSGFPFFGIWTQSTVRANFVCLEPWCGIADTVTASGILQEKKGIMSLAAAEQKSFQFDIEVH